MHYWHAAHFASWGRPALLERSLGWYNAILPSAREKARQQGYAGARWPKMTAPDGRDSPSPIGPLLIWQQPHPIAMAEMIYAAHPTRDTLARYRDIVFESAEFMASYAHYDRQKRALRAGSARHPRPGKSSAARNLEPHLRTRNTGTTRSPSRNAGGSAPVSPASPSGTRSAPNCPPCP